MDWPLTRKACAFTAPGSQRSQTLELAKGVNYIPLAQQPLSDGDWSAELRQDGHNIVTTPVVYRETKATGVKYSLAARPVAKTTKRTSKR